MERGIDLLREGVVSHDASRLIPEPAKHISAAGDVIGFPALASTSMEQARRAVRYAFRVDLTGRASGLLPTGVYTIPEVGMVGETEESLERAGDHTFRARAAESSAIPTVS